MAFMKVNQSIGNGPSNWYKDKVWCKYTSLGYEPTGAYRINILFLAILNSVFALTAIVLNSFVITAFLRNRTILNGANIILFGLCLADVLSGLIGQTSLSAVLFFVFTNGKEDFDCVLLTIASLSGNILVGISFLTVSFVSLERLISIFYPYLHERVFTKAKMILGSVLIWIFTIAFQLYCFLAKEKIMFFVVQSITISLAYIWTLIVYFKILKQVRVIAKEEADLQRRLHKKEEESELKANRIVSFVIISLLVCYILQVVVSFVTAFSHRIRVIDNYIAFWAYTFGIINCSLNPLVYCYCNSEIRMKVYELIGVSTRGNAVSSETVRPTPTRARRSSKDTN